MKKSEATKAMTATGKTREAVIVFFDSIIERRFSDAEKSLEEVKGRKYSNPDFQEGYNKALEGMLTSSRSGDERDFLNKAVYTEEGMNKYLQDFRGILKTGFPKPFDLGFFAAWSDLMHYREAAKKFIKQ
jgi:hypothetical protein